MPSTVQVANEDLTEIGSKPDGGSLPLPSQLVSCSKVPIEEVIDVRHADCPLWLDSDIYRATNNLYFCVGSEISISIRFAMSFSGWWTLGTR